MSRSPLKLTTTRWPKVSWPYTRFKARIIRLDSTGPLSIDWDKVVRYEADRVVAWLKFLHLRHLDDAHLLLDALVQITTPPDAQPTYTRCPQWKIYSENQLPSVLVDIVSDPGMFSCANDDEMVKVSFRKNMNLCAYIDHSIRGNPAGDHFRPG